jgi:hypothetical protein
LSSTKRFLSAFTQGKWMRFVFALAVQCPQVNSRINGGAAASRCSQTDEVRRKRT